MQSKRRKANIELLRIIAMSGVIFLHYFNPTIGGGIEYVNNGSINECCLKILEAINIPAVNLFIMISGYFLCKSNKRSIGRGLSLLIQVILINLLFYIAKAFLGKIEVCFDTILQAILPVNWFMILYVVLYIISPLINFAYCGLPDNVQHNNPRFLNKRTTLVGLFTIFSVLTTVVDILAQTTGNEFKGLSPLGMYGSERGYTLVQFVLCYIIGAFISYSDINKIKKRYCLLIWITSTLIVFLWSYWDTYTSYEYCNPMNIVSATAILTLFLKIEIQNEKAEKFITTLSGCALTVYLIHNYLITHVGIEKYVNEMLPIMLIHILAVTAAIILISFVLDKVYKLVMKKPISKLSSLWSYSIKDDIHSLTDT